MEKRREKEERKRQRAMEKQNQDPTQQSGDTDTLDDELRQAALEQQRLFGGQ